MFDRTLLTEAIFEFVVIADTHYMLDPQGQQVEFQSRLKQSGRGEIAKRLAASLDAKFVMHLGDVVQEFPETPRFGRAMAEVKEQMAAAGFRAYHVAGNQDVGDKPDPTSPGLPATAESLAAFQREFGPSWYAFDSHGVHFVVANSQIMNTDLPAAEQQRLWLERELEDHHGRRIVLFVHMPPYLGDPSEPHLGHYDNIGEPDRSWLLDLVRRHRVELLLCGHVHFSFYDRIDSTRFLSVVSPSFTRPGFSHAFTSAAPPEQGRDDSGKLGFYLARVMADRTDLHFIRTEGWTARPEPLAAGARILLTRPSADSTASPIGITARHPIGHQTQVPTAWPSIVRQPIRNDIPLLACAELGVGRVRTPLSDLDDEFQSSRLAILREDGVDVVATHLWPGALDVERLSNIADRFDELEIQIAGGLPDAICLDVIRAAQSRLGQSITLSAVVAKQPIAGKQHPRTRMAYRPNECIELDSLLDSADIRIDRAIVQIDAGADTWTAIEELRRLPELKRIGAIDFCVELAANDDHGNARLCAEAILAARLLPDCRVYFDPFIDMDRTMDVNDGLLDAMCNPRPAFHVVRCLNAVLTTHFPAEPPHGIPPRDGSGLRIRGLSASNCIFAAVHRTDSSAADTSESLLNAIPQGTPGHSLSLYRLAEGFVESREWPPTAAVLDDGLKTGPILLEIPLDSRA